MTNYKQTEVPPNKSYLTVITSFIKETGAQPSVTFYNILIPINLNPTIFGVTLNPMLTFRKHPDIINIKAKCRLNVL